MARDLLRRGDVGVRGVINVRDWERRINAVATRPAAFPRDLAIALRQTALDAAVRLRGAINNHIDQPAAFTRRAIRYEYPQLSTVTRTRDARARVFVQPRQSTYLKYLTGEAPSGVRRPGDVGPGATYIYVPLWDNMRRIERIRPRNGESFPPNVLGRLLRETGQQEGTINRRRRMADGYEAKFFGRPRPGKGFGIWARPRREWDPVQRRMRALRPLSLLVRAVDRASYEPILVRPWNVAVTEAIQRLPDRMQARLDRRIRQARGTP